MFIHVPCVLEKCILVYAVHSIRFDLLFVWVISSVFLIVACVLGQNVDISYYDNGLFLLAVLSD